MNASVKVVLYKSKKLSNGDHPVMLRVTKDRKPKYISLGFSCTPDLWDEQKHLPKKQHPLYKEAKILFAKRKLEAERLIYEMENEDKNLSAYELKRKIKKQKSNINSVFLYFDNIITAMKESGKIKTSEVYKDTKRNLINFTNSREFSFSEIDVQFVSKFEEFLKKKGKGRNTIYIYLRTLRALINKAIKEDICSEKYYAFKNFSLARYSRYQTQKRAISKEDINKIKSLNLSKYPHLRDAKNIFLFSYYCRGINFIDISLLKWKDVVGNRIFYKRQKTQELFNIEILRPVQDILNYYRKTTFKGDDSRIFPLIKETHVTPVSIYNRRLKMLRKINSDLKEIGSLANISSPLTTYVARHTYATILKRSGVSTAIISQALGHESEKTTQIYLDSFENTLLDEASKVLL